MSVRDKIVKLFVSQKYDLVISNFIESSPYLDNDDEILSLVGLSYSHIKNYTQAIKHFEKAYNANKKISYKYNLAITYTLSKNIDYAIDAYKSIISDDKNHISSYVNLSDIYIKFCDYNKAIVLLKDITPKHKENILLNYNYGVALLEERRFELAITFFQNVVNVDANHRDALYNQANSYRQLGDFKKSISICKKLISLNKSDSESIFNLGYCLFMLNNHKEGLELYESRFKLNSHLKPSFSPKGKSLIDYANPKKSSTILVIYEQGFGDTINFSGYVNKLKEIYKNVLFLVQPELISLFNESFDCAFYTDYKSLPEYEYFIYVASLPLYSLRQGNNLKHPKPFLKTSLDTRKKWKKIISNNKRKKIGISWTSTQSNFIVREINQYNFLSNLPEENDYFCLHKVIDDDDLDFINKKSNFHQYCNDINNFHDTAALCQEMDEVITIDTSIAHLSSALGVKTTVLLAFVPDWRWGFQGTKSIWYENTNLIRQKKDGDWNQPLSDMLNCLK